MRVITKHYRYTDKAKRKESINSTDSSPELFIDKNKIHLNKNGQVVSDNNIYTQADLDAEVREAKIEGMLEIIEDIECYLIYRQIGEDLLEKLRDDIEELRNG